MLKTRQHALNSFDTTFSVKLHLRDERTNGRTDKEIRLPVIVFVRGVHPMGGTKSDAL